MLSGCGATTPCAPQPRVCKHDDLATRNEQCENQKRYVLEATGLPKSFKGASGRICTCHRRRHLAPLPSNANLPCSNALPTYDPQLAYLSFVECNRKTEGPRSKPACLHSFPAPAMENGSGTSAHANASLPDLINLLSLCDLILGVMEAKS